MSERRDELSCRLRAIERRIGAACAAAGRPRDDVHLIVVTKTYPASDVVDLASLGVRDIGENRHPEAGRKCAEVDDPALTWHFVGALQTKKANQVARYADWVHSVDRPKLVRSLSTAAELAGRELQCLIEVRLSGTDGRAGVDPGAAVELAEAVAESPGLVLRGVMGVAPLGEDPAPSFDVLRGVRDRLVADHPSATAMSAGMSEDMEAAVAAGATHLRIGRAVLGERPIVQ